MITQLNMYTTVAGELPKLVQQNKAQTFIPYSDVLKLKYEIIAASGGKVIRPIRMPVGHLSY